MRRRCRRYYTRSCIVVHRNCLYVLTSSRKREITRVLLLFYVPSISTMADTINCWGDEKDIWKTALLNALLFIIIRPLALYCTGLKIGIVFIRLSDYQPPTEKSKYVDGGGVFGWGCCLLCLILFCYYWVNLMWVSPIPNILQSAGRKRSRKGFRNQSKHLFKLAALW